MHFIKLDMGERKFIISTQYKFEKEKWYEALKNCRRTIKEIKNSISQKPKNVSYLVNLYEKDGEKAVKEIAEKKKDEILGKFQKM